MAGCGIEGRYEFDALCVFAPNFAFKAQASGRVAVEAFGQTLIAVSLDILLEGPSPWHVRGRGSVSLLWEDISLDFDVTWGDPAPLVGEPPPIEDELRRALKEPRAWVPDSIGAERSGVVLRPERRGEDPVLHPLGRLHARQQRVPFEVTITRYDGADLPTPQRWAIEGARLGSSEDFSRGDALRDEFPRAHYFGLSESDQLSSRGIHAGSLGCGAGRGECAARTAPRVPRHGIRRESDRLARRRTARPAQPSPGRRSDWRDHHSVRRRARLAQDARGEAVVG